MKVQVQEVCTCDECGNEFVIPQGRVGSSAYLVDLEKDTCMQADFCPDCSKSMVLKILHIRKQIKR